MRIFDELNSGQSILSIDEYFDTMNLSEEEKKKRKTFANEIMNAMLFIFALISIMRQYDYLNKQFIIQQLEQRYSDIVIKYMDIDKYMEDCIREFSQETIDTTLKHPDEEYYLSNDRAMLIGENEANSSLNYGQFAEAVKRGKKEKRWITEGDNKVRKTHREVDLEVISINDTFVVGNSLMRFPKDDYYNPEPEEIVNCRCTIEYF